MIAANRNFLCSSLLYIRPSTSSDFCISLNLSSLRFSSTDKFAKYKPGKRAQAHKAQHGSRRNKLALPSTFEEKLKSWPKLLQHELDAEHEQLNLIRSNVKEDELAQRGFAICDLAVAKDETDPLSGRRLILQSYKQNFAQLKKFRSGAPLVLSEDSEGGRSSNSVECILQRVDKDFIEVKIRGSQTGRRMDFSSKKLILKPSTTEGALQDLTEFIGEVEKGNVRKPGMQLVHYAYRSHSFPSVHNDRRPQLVQALNEDQTRAVAAAINKKRPFVSIQGPPGTGKTSVVSEIIMQLVRDKQKVLVCAPSNMAVDNIMRRVEDASQTCRFGAGLVETFTDELHDHPQYNKLKEFYDEITHITGNAPQAHDGPSVRRMKMLSTEASKLRYNMKKDVLSKKLVVFSTIGSATVRQLEGYGWHPSVVIIDEAAQALEAATWVPVLAGRRCVLAGDHAQLPAVIHSIEGRKGELHISLMERLATELGDKVNVMLTVQHRSNDKIMKWSADTFYESRLVAHESVKSIRLSDISQIKADSVWNSPLIFVDMDQDEERSGDEASNPGFSNRSETEVVVNYIDKLLAAGLRQRSIGVISPYYGQVARLRSLLEAREGLSVNTVDGFQGQEREVIIFSLVRDNEAGHFGFLQEARRLNVAVTRAKRQFVLVGSGRMMRRSKVFRGLLKVLVDEGIVVAPSQILEIHPRLVCSEKRRSRNLS